jgi:hypothetical protein
VLSSDEGRGKFAVRGGERRQSFGDLKAHFGALRCECISAGSCSNSRIPSQTCMQSNEIICP